jgi:hypothetical protein
MAQKKYALHPRTQKIRKTPTGDWIYCSFSARPDEVARWRELAVQADRSLSWWIRNILNREIGLIENEASNGKDEKISLENISPNRA